MFDSVFKQKHNPVQTKDHIDTVRRVVWSNSNVRILSILSKGLVTWANKRTGEKLSQVLTHPVIWLGWDIYGNADSGAHLVSFGSIYFFKLVSYPGENPAPPACKLMPDIPLGIHNSSWHSQSSSCPWSFYSMLFPMDSVSNPVDKALGAHVKEVDDNYKWSICFVCLCIILFRLRKKVSDWSPILAKSTKTTFKPKRVLELSWNLAKIG